MFNISLLPILIIFMGIFIVLFKRDKKPRKTLVIKITSFSLASNTALLIFYGLSNTVQRIFYFNFERGTLTLIELILFIGLCVSLFSKDEIELVINENIHDGLILTIILGLCCYALSLNILMISIWLIFILIFLGMIFFYSDYFKPLNLLKFYIIGVIGCIILLFISVLSIYLQYQTLIITDIPKLNNIFLYIIFLISIGLPCGFFPLTIYPLRKFFQECSYTNLLLYFCLSIVSSVQIIRVLAIFAFSSQINTFILISLSSIGFLVSIISIMKELFGKFDGATFSIKKLFGYFICADFNMLIFLSSFIPIITTLGMEINFYHIINFYIGFNSLIKLYIFLIFYPIMLETKDDNLHLLGDFWFNYRIFGVFYLLLGFIIAIPYSFTLLQSISIILSTTVISESSLYLSIFALLEIFILLFIIVILCFISIGFILIFFGNKPEYVKREEIKKTNIFHNLPNIIILCLMGIFIFYFYYGNYIYYYWFNGLFLIP